MKQALSNDLSHKFPKGIIIIHWITALFIIILFPMGKFMADLEPMEKMLPLKVHAFLGIMVFVLTIVRVWMNVKLPQPAKLKTSSKWNDRLISIIHKLFYVALLGLSVSGIATMILGGYGEAIKTGNYNLILPHDQIASYETHDMLAGIMILLLLAHVAGIVKHYFNTKENTLKRMM